MGKGSHLVTALRHLALQQGQDVAELLAPLGTRVAVVDVRTPGDPIVGALVWDDGRKQLVKTKDLAAAYAADIVYGTEQALNFDYQRGVNQRPLFYAISDEFDRSLLGEQGVMPRSISQQVELAVESASEKEAMAQLAARIRPGMLTVDLDTQQVKLKEEFRKSLPDGERFDEMASNPAFMRLLFASLVKQLEASQVPLVDVSYAYGEENVMLNKQGLEAVEQGFLGLPASVNLTEMPLLQHYLHAALYANYFFKRSELGKAGEEKLKPGVQAFRISDKGEIVLIENGEDMPGQEVSDGFHQALQAKAYLDEPNLEVRGRIQFTLVGEYQSQLTPGQYAGRYPFFNTLSATTGNREEQAELQEHLGLAPLSLPSDQGVSLIRDQYPDQYYRTVAEQISGLQNVTRQHKWLGGTIIGTYSPDKLRRLSVGLMGTLRRQGIPVQILSAATPAEMTDAQRQSLAGRAGEFPAMTDVQKMSLLAQMNTTAEIVRTAQDRAAGYRRDLDTVRSIADPEARKLAEAEVTARYQKMPVILCVISSQMSDESPQLDAIREIAKLPFVITITNPLGARGFSVMGEDILAIEAEKPKNPDDTKQLFGRVARQGLFGYAVKIYGFEDDEMLQKHIPALFQKLLTSNILGNLIGTRWGQLIIAQIDKAQLRISRQQAGARAYYYRYFEPVNSADLQRREIETRLREMPDADLQAYIRQAIRQDISALVQAQMNPRQIRRTAAEQLAAIVARHTQYQDSSQWGIEALKTEIQNQKQFPASLVKACTDAIDQAMQKPGKDADRLRNRLLQAMENQAKRLKGEDLVYIGFEGFVNALTGRGDRDRGFPARRASEGVPDFGPVAVGRPASERGGELRR